MKMEGFNVCGGRLTSNRTQWALAPNFFSQATRKSQFFFQRKHMLGTLDFTDSEHWALFNFC